MILFTFFHFFPVISLLNKPTVPENGTHHTTAVERKTAKSPSPLPPQPFPSLSHLDPRCGTRSTAYRVSGPVSVFDPYMRNTRG